MEEERKRVTPMRMAEWNRPTAEQRVAEIEQRIGYFFNDRSLLIQAFRRKSYAEEEAGGHNEELEFLGDSVLGMVVVKALAERYGQKVDPEGASETPFEGGRIPSVREREAGGWYRFDMDEGGLTKMKQELVRKETLARAMDDLRISQYLLMGKGDEKMGLWREPSVKEDLFEAIVGAVAIDCGWHFPTLERVVSGMLRLEHRLEYGITEEGMRYKKNVEVWYAAAYKGEKPTYEIKADPVRKGFFLCTLSLDYRMEGAVIRGYGRTREGALYATAQQAWKRILAVRERADRVYEIIGNEVDRNQSVNHLQEAWQKGLVEQPRYELEALTGSERNGDNRWKCNCHAGGFESGWYLNATKTDAKKDAASDILMQLLGINTEQLMMRFGTAVPSDRSSENDKNN